MKKNIYFLFVSLFASSCATIVPATSKYKTEVSDSDRKYQFEKISVDSSKITYQEKLVAKNLLFEYHSFRVSLEKLAIGNDSILTKNNYLNNTYSTTNGIVGGLGGLTAIGTIFASWTVIVPIATGVWNLMGLGIQKLNVTPELDKGNSIKDQCISLNNKFIHSRDLFYLFVTSKTASEAEANFRQWREELNSVLEETATFFGVQRTFKPN